jgi:hypothetical protein
MTLRTVLPALTLRTVLPALMRALTLMHCLVLHLLVPIGTRHLVRHWRLVRPRRIVPEMGVLLACRPSRRTHFAI